MKQNRNNQDGPVKAPLRDDTFTYEFLSGEEEGVLDAIADLQRRFSVDFITVGLAPTLGAPLKWLYHRGATSQRLLRITLAPGHGVGGIVLKSGMPMLFTDLDSQLDPREYSSFPIVFAEDLRSFCALPLRTEKRVAGVLLIGHRSANLDHSRAYLDIIEHLGGRFCGLEVISEPFCTPESVHAENAMAQTKVPQEEALLLNTITAQELERKRLSRELHDGAVQELLAVTLKAEVAKRHIDPAYRELAEEMILELNHVMNELRNVSVDLRPSTLDDLGLKAALTSQARLYEQRYGFATKVRGTLGSTRFERTTETQVYRILQEAMWNACKYSGADAATVTLDVASNVLTAAVTDEGAGFDTENPTILGTGCGLEGMRERAQLIRAKLDISSTAGRTTITLVVPIKPE